MGLTDNIPFPVESWLWYGFVTFVVTARFLSRILHFGHPKYLQLDDWLMCLAQSFFTAEIVTMNIVVKSDSNLFPPGYLETHNLTPADKRHRVYGSKMVVVVEQCQLVTIWICKATLLLMYHRITVNSFPKHNIAIKLLAGYVAFGFVFMEVFYFCVWCRPFSNYWAVPTPNPNQCAAAINHLITNAVFNISSDVIMLCIALPMFIYSQLPLKRKAILCTIFGLGFFVIVCAVLNKLFSFTHPFGYEWTYWYVRESATAMLVANLPYLWTLLRRIFGFKSFSGDQTSSGNYWRNKSGTALLNFKIKFKRNSSSKERPSDASSNPETATMEMEDRQGLNLGPNETGPSEDLLQPTGRQDALAMAPLEEEDLWEAELQSASYDTSRTSALHPLEMPEAG